MEAHIKYIFILKIYIRTNLRIQTNIRDFPLSNEEEIVFI